MNFENPKKSLLGIGLTMIYQKFWTFILKIKFRRDCPAFYYLCIFSAFSGLRAISSKLLKVNRIEFRKSEKILPREWSKGVILKILAIYLENWALERMPRFVVFRAFLAIQMSSQICSIKLNKWALKFEFHKSEKNPS